MQNAWQKIKDKFILHLKSKPFILALIFLSALILFESIFLSQSYESIVLSRHFTNGTYIKFFTFIFLTTISLILTLYFIWSAFASPFKHRIIYLILFSLAIIAEYSYQFAFNRFSRFEDAQNAVIAADMQIRMQAATIYFNYLTIIPCLIFGLFLLTVKPTLKKNWLNLFSNIIFLFSFFSFTAYFTHNVFHTISFGAFFRTTTSFPIIWHFGTTFQPPRKVFFNQSRQQITFQTNTLPKNNIVFIVDESVRGDHLSLNGYTRKTTPLLDDLQKQGSLQNWGLAVSGTTCSLTSNNLMLTGLTDLPDLDFKTYKLPTIFQYAKAAGYKNFYFDGQVSQLWNGKPADIADYGEWITSKEFADKKSFEVDAEIARRVKNVVENSTGNFIWINKFGIHKPYQNSYPQTETVWSATNISDDSTAFYDKNVSQESLINSYDNALLYNSESFFNNLLSQNLSANTFYVYTSDHGQTLLENGAIASHCSDTKPEAIVPLFIIGNLQNQVDTKYRASHSNIFATLLDLMNFPESERKFSYATSLFKAKESDSKPRFYYTGDLHSTSFGGKRQFDE